MAATESVVDVEATTQSARTGADLVKGELDENETKATADAADNDAAPSSASSLKEETQRANDKPSSTNESSDEDEDDDDCSIDLEKGVSFGADPSPDEDGRTTAATVSTSENLTFQLPFSTWDRDRWIATGLGCLSSSAVLTVRLMLDTEPTAYLIHSIVVFFDMVLIHLFTNCRWLSISGELTTVVSFLLFHFTKETIWELTETTFIAMLCSFHLIASRNKHKEREETLEVDMRILKRESIRVLRSTSNLMKDNSRNETSTRELEDLIQNGSPNVNKSNLGSSWFVVPTRVSMLSAVKHEECRRMAISCGEKFFEYFLDGSAGVMYTSFLGLIISEIITWSEERGSGGK